MKSQIKSISRHITALVIFVILAFGYFAPAVFENKTLPQGDVINYLGASQEVREYAKTEESKEHETIAWLGSMFSGMPSYVTSIPKSPTNFLSYLEKPIKSLNYDGAGIILLGLICFYILMCVLKVNFALAIAGSIAFAFSSYNIIILEAGHITKAYVIAYMPLTIAGIYLVCKEKYLWGSLLTLLGVALSFRNNHVQISYYLALFSIFLYLPYIIKELKEKHYGRLNKSAAIFLLVIIFAFLPNLNGLYSNYESSKESTRGKSELTETHKDENKKVSGGLDIDYAFSWSYGKAETMTLLIPNFYGGSSGGELGKDSELYKAMKSKGMQTGRKLQTATYWGTQPFTSGPVYLGAIVCFLFVLGMFVIKNPLKWWIFTGTVFFILLAWGKNLMFFNEFLFHYLPFYNKFRVPSMSLVIPALTFPLIAIWGLKEFFSEEHSNAKKKKALLYSTAMVGTLCLIFWLIPGAFLDFQSPNDIQYGFPDWYYNALVQDRESLLKADALRSLLFILLAAGSIFAFLRAKKPKQMARYISISICLLIFIDLCGVDLRYIDYDSFVPQKAEANFKKTNADKFILQDKNPSYRVLNLNNPFNESRTSYYHKSIGGYSGAKVGRYQELIDRYISGEINGIIGSFQKIKTLEDLKNLTVFEQTPVLNMLNARYIIYNPEQQPIINTQAKGNAWFVEKIRFVENADEELKQLGSTDVATTALVDKRFADKISSTQATLDKTAHIELLSYEPVKLIYKTKAQKEQIAVFSEVYYPYGWQAYIDGKEVEHFRADWILRAMLVPAGEHTIEFRFVPKTYLNLARVAWISSLLILLGLIFAIGWSIKKKYIGK